MKDTEELFSEVDQAYQNYFWACENEKDTAEAKLEVAHSVLKETLTAERQEMVKMVEEERVKTINECIVALVTDKDIHPKAEAVLQALVSSNK